MNMDHEHEALIAVTNLSEINFEIYIRRNSFLIRLSPELELGYLFRYIDGT
jgi:hypothetical protein